MAQFYTLEEAARVLGLSPDDLKGKAQHREVRAFLDGGSWRFRVADVDELARRRGLGSDADLNLSDLDLPGDSGGEIDLSEFQLGTADPDLGSPTTEFGRPGSDHDLLLDDLSLPPNPVSGSSSVIIGMDSAGKLPSDSDVRLLPENAGGGVSDSDVRLAVPDPKAPSDSDVTLIADDTSQHDLLSSGSGSGSSSGDTAVRPSPLLGSSAEVSAQADSDSDFELTPSSVIDALQPDSGSDFELDALDGSDEYAATPVRKPSDSDVTAGDPGLSGIGLSRPSDSGINLETAAGLNFTGAESIELAPLSGSDIKATGSTKKPHAKAKAKPSSKGKPNPGATPLPGAAKGGKDIFDDTDFEVDALASMGDESDDRTMQLDAASDFEIEESDSGSEVFAVDEDDVDQNAGTAIASSPILDDDDEEDDGFEDATSGSGEMASGAWEVESEGTSSRPSPAVLASRDTSAEWGGLWVGLLGATTVFMLLLTFIGMDLVRNLYEVSADTPASGLVKTLAGLIGK